ncbi:BRI1 kinase inhibitor 1 [Lactuca sativa]|uniref:BRI1 kinase inhibitor 1 n=1 Tax=Lactuca sativa TaxID=4236 RepID=A0A9R1V8K3_LACSA|nr:BRI1 kinase inhibitor 1 [Lactuca sativa]KAJ0200268.1 hypothetical protein LSAT_V11C600340660 [Lactuca sativa]
MMDNADDEQTYFNKQESMLLHQTSQNPCSPPSSPPPATASPSSVSSSPTHEFSFTVSLHPNPPPIFTQRHNSDTYDSDNNHKTDTTSSLLPYPPLTAIDLSPADDIFFHGHLLPLHLLSPLPVSPRSSTNSMDSYTLPSSLLYDQTNPIGNTSFHCHHQTAFSDFEEPEVAISNQNRPKSKSFSLFSIPKWKKRSDDERERGEDQNTKKLKLDLGQLIKRYMKMVRPLLSFPKSRRSNTTFNHQSYSFSGNSLSSKSSKLPHMNRGGKRRGQFSAPASMRTSPANSGIILNSGTVSPAKSTTSESTMEELHAAIQAAIAHCKNSIAIEEKIQSEN